MKKICFILFLFISVTSYSQTFWYPVWLKSTVKMTGIPGTGTLLGIDVSGNVSKVLGVGATSVTGLTPYEILTGDVTGVINQSPNFQWSDGFGGDILYITGTSPQISITESGDAATYSNLAAYLTLASGAASELTGDYLRFYDDDGGSLGIYKTDDNMGVSYDIYLPAAQGGANTFLKNDGSGNLTWASGSGEVNTASNLGGGLANYDSKSGVDLRFNSFLASDFNLASNLISLDYTNGQKATTSTIGFLTDTDWDTFNNKVGLVHSEEHTAQTTSTGATTVYTTPAADGYYRISVTATVTTAAGSAMDLAVQLRYTEATDNVNKTFPTANVNNYNRTQTNTTGATVAISSVCHVKASTDIKYLTGWSPTGGSPQYNVHITVEKL